MGARVSRLPALRTCSPRCRAAARFRTGNGSKSRVAVHFRSLGLRRAKKIFLLDVEAAVMGRKYSVSARNIFAFEWEISNVRVKGSFFFFWKFDQGTVSEGGKEEGDREVRALSIQSLTVAPVSDEIPIFR